MEKENQSFEPLEVLAQCISVANLYRQGIDTFVSEHGLQKSQERLLLTIDKMKEKKICQKDIAEKMRVTPAAVAVTLKNLEKMGIIRKIMSKEDNRYNDIVLTEEGKKIVAESEEKVNSIDQKAFKGFSESEKSNLQDYLERICTNLKTLK